MTIAGKTKEVCLGGKGTDSRVEFTNLSVKRLDETPRSCFYHKWHSGCFHSGGNPDLLVTYLVGDSAVQGCQYG